MSSKALVGGTSYRVKQGKTLVGGANYTIKRGKTLIGGTNYTINLVENATVSVTGTSAYSEVKVNGITTSSTNFTISPGTSITVNCSAAINTGAWYAYPTFKITFNGATVASRTGTTCSYEFVAEEGRSYTIAFTGIETKTGTTSSYTRYTIMYTNANITSK